MTGTEAKTAAMRALTVAHMRRLEIWKLSKTAGGWVVQYALGAATFPDRVAMLTHEGALKWDMEA